MGEASSGGAERYAHALMRAQRDPDCMVTIGSSGIVGRAGDQFGAGPEYVRIELLMRWQEFLILVQKLAVLASN